MEPKIRLKGFSGDWEDTTIGNIATVVGGGTPSTINPLYWNGPIQWFTPSEVGHTKYVEKSERTITKDGIDGSSARIIPANSLLLSSRATIGEASINICECTTNQGFQSLVPINVDLEFLYSLMITKKSDLLRESNGSTFLEISASKVKSIDICVPEKNEQQALGSYFQHLDSLIQSTTKKIESLKQVKVASLQSMFPQEGETTPRVRFKGFEGEWRNSFLGSLFAERCEYDATAEMLSVSQSQGIIKAADNGRFDNSNSDKSKYKLVKVNDIAYNSMRMWQGACGCSQYEGIVSPAYTVVAPKEHVYSKFFYYMFKTDQMLKIFRLNSQGLTSDTWNLKYPAFSKLQICYPASLEEQQMIADYFSNLDSQISLQSQRLEKLKQIKSACLDYMFV